ncbi:MAG: TIR domain-containing protein, partial [Planctomycetaceae bacterium]
MDSTQFAAQCFEYLTARFGARSVFWDQESIADDSDWKQSICARLDASDAVLCIVGPQWNSLLQQRRNDPSDCVRFELEYAATLRRPVVVVLIEGAAAPTAEQLP